MVQEVPLTFGGGSQVRTWLTPALNIGRSGIGVLWSQPESHQDVNLVTHPNIVGYVGGVTRPEVNIDTARSDESAFPRL